jgi:hypothetical protein
VSRFRNDGPSLAPLSLPNVGRISRAEANTTVQNPDTHSTIADHFASGAATVEDPANQNGTEHDRDHEMISFDRLALGSYRV